MPITLRNEIGIKEIIESLHYIQEQNHFLLKTKSDFKISVPYYPDYFSQWDQTKFSIYLFENPYLNAELDIFPIYKKDFDERLGYMIPLSILETSDINYDEESYRHLREYKTMAYYKLLELDKEILYSNNGENIFRLSEIFNCNSICILHNPTVEQSGFDISSSILSLYNFGYILRENQSKPVYDKAHLVKKMRIKQSRLTLRPSNFKIESNSFIYSLFRDHLLQTDNVVVRFILLYQIIEGFIEEEFNKQFDQLLDNYTKKEISKNDLKESMSTISTERELINSIFTNCDIDNKLKQEFSEECDFLLNDLKIVLKKIIFLIRYTP
ncbi:hypothetical protein HYN59_00770 [Flavobacterium album]|uniref:Uncharacterized protein n=1 Tax=Flavobacterium album TaxID=2175091 RepID=A0A2S1QTL9_9FLAO|nr:hypothetical protein [Flavobacterium album]AWH83735.1 hypothetical protein HYN59_00770 [Flavobacterium album]